MPCFVRDRLIKPTSLIRDAIFLRELQASRGVLEAPWTLEAEKRRRGDPPAASCRLYLGLHGTAGSEPNLKGAETAPFVFIKF